ncbi:hypothetical protein Smp_156560 [Schistosoma mansoni]|uniref:hypothetical protein n=1 Tax=Schistosoma mansoni TaxID=6183 RepID=UPI0001A6425D|nr:hypothetical protein Smp_156560 [Schistosoma mansoni]|eukprot:XP_018647148.1 hypothetical protein Smp_156560 [Schistosoma mansoni]
MTAPQHGKKVNDLKLFCKIKVRTCIWPWSSRAAGCRFAVTCAMQRGERKVWLYEA